MAGAPVQRGNHVVPDGGWGWVVVLSSFTLQALSIGRCTKTNPLDWYERADISHSMLLKVNPIPL